jgi:hypothetical protein
MYIEFDLLPDVDMAPGHRAAANLRIIQESMLTWGKRYNILYREKTIKYTHRVTFDHDESYTFWAMSWNPEQHKILAQYRIVSDLNNKI